jgi:hypothetical protein
MPRCEPPAPISLSPATRVAKPPSARPSKARRSSPPRSTTTASAPGPKFACSVRRKAKSSCGPTSSVLPRSIPTGRCTNSRRSMTSKPSACGADCGAKKAITSAAARFPPPVPEVSIRELSVQEDGDGHTYLKIEPLHAPALVYETGDSDPTSASSPCRRQPALKASALRYRFLAFDPADMVRVSAVKEWTAKLRLKYQLAQPRRSLRSRAAGPAQGQRHRHPLHHRWFLAHQRRLCDLRRAIPRPGELPRCLRHGGICRLRPEL